MKVLITGGSGLLGSSLLSVMPPEYDPILTYKKHKPKIKVTSLNVDFIDTERIKRVIKYVKPKLIIHTAAITDIEWCELYQKKAYLINVTATRSICEAAKIIDAKVVYISTDYVFDGTKGMRKEKDITNPLNFYAKTKLLGENFFLKNSLDSLIIRTSFYGIPPYPGKNDYFSHIISGLTEKAPIYSAVDQYFNPIFSNQLSSCVFKLCASNKNGIFHIACLDKVNRYEFALFVADMLNLDKSLIKKVSVKELRRKLNWRAKRPLDTSLCVKKASETIKLPSVESSLRECVNLYIRRQ